MHLYWPVRRIGRRGAAAPKITCLEERWSMVNYNLIADIGIDELEVESLVREALGEQAATGNMEGLLQEDIENFQRGNILKGKIVGKAGDDVVIDVGLKSEGLVNKGEFEDYDDLEVGDVIEVLLEELEDDTGAVRLSKRKADRIRGWEKILETKREDDVVEGKCMRKIKGGLLVDIGVPVFLPASQVDIRRPSDIGAYIGKMIRAVILKVDEERRNIVISRRRLIEKEREAAKNDLLSSVKEGDIIKGSVTNIADFGAFVDLGGLDGLLHITDMSWGRVSHPSDRVRIGEEIQVKILSIDRDKEKIALGLKQLEESPWDKIDAKYPIGSRVRGKVVNLVSYGAFVQLEEGIEGLVHISEMSWTRRVNHPSELVNVEDEVDVVVLDINRDKHEISLGIKQTEVNPWELVAEKYPPGTIIEGTIRNPRQLRGVRGDRARHRRPAARVGHLLDGEDLPPEREVQEGRLRQVRGARHRPGEAAGRAGPEAAVGGPVAAGNPRRVQARHGRAREGDQDHQLRRVRGVGGRPRGPASYLRAVRPQGRDAAGRRQGGRRGGR
jgi:small subunit ribosomal protein S1